MGKKPNSGLDFFLVNNAGYAEDAKIYKRHIDSFFTESGKMPFGHRLLVLTTGKLGEHVEKARYGQQIPCSTLNLLDLEDSSIDWSKYAPGSAPVYKPKKVPRPDQKRAIEAVLAGLDKADRGKLLMACGSGKTFTALKIAEKMAGKGGRVLFLVPSLSLLSQTLTEWTADSEIPLHSFAVCSDVSIGKRKLDDDSDITMYDLAFPATTIAEKIAAKMAHHPDDKMMVVFATYHSIQVLSQSQKRFDVPEFDLIICDEAHRTTGATLVGEDESNFVKVHDQDFIKGKKRIYMTATPRIFGDAVKARAEEEQAILCSMDDPGLYGETLFTLSFSEAVHLGLLSDYKVLVLAVDEEYVSQSVQKLLIGADSELKLDDATKIIGCWKALSKQGVKEGLGDDMQPMKRAVAFSQTIKDSKRIEGFFPQVVSEYLQQEGNEVEDPLQCEVRHVDGTNNSIVRKERLDWLKGSSGDNQCRILTNARCLSEGVDVPALDSILFLNPRKSQVDVVQSVGRVMRRSPGKQRGYVILPIGIPPGVPPDQALSKNEKYKVVWQILQALRAHDDRFDAMINKIDLGVDVTSKMEIIAVTNTLNMKRVSENGDGQTIGKGGAADDEVRDSSPKPKPENQLSLEFGELEKAIYAKIVKKCGNRRHWEEWAGDIAKIAQSHITRISAALKNYDSRERKAFDSFLEEVRDDLNETISETDAIEMLAQHIITKPVFDALFEGYDFAASNPVSRAMQGVLEVFDEHNLEKEAESLSRFYTSVRYRASGINSAEGKQRIILELYDKFFRNAFPRLTEKLGIVYTPVEVVDFIIHSVNDVLQSEFGETLGSDGVHILDPFVGTGTFITRLLQSGLIKPEEFTRKYENEIHANEIVLLAYYIAAINIEAVYHSLSGGDYKPFSGICLTDTFQLYEKDDMISRLLVDNSSRRARQKELDIRVIIGNPPYSAGQRSANDNNANVSYPCLDESIRGTYAAKSDATNRNALYDSYIRAIRWATDRIGDSGIVAYVTNAGWIDGNAMDGMRKCLADEFSTMYIFHLRGNQRTQGEQSRKEGGKIFGSGSRAPITISVFVKNPAVKERGKVFFYDIGDYLSREEKLSIISRYKSIDGIAADKKWQRISPDKHGDWLGQRDEGFEQFIKLGDKSGKTKSIVFANYSSGLKTNRDAWCYNSSKDVLSSNMMKMIEFYNIEVERYITASKKQKISRIEDFVTIDAGRISWSGSLNNDLSKAKKHSFSSSSVVPAIYRPFTKAWSYFSQAMNERIYQMPRIFPTPECDNRVIAVTGIGARGFSVLMSAVLPDIQCVFNGQCFPLKLYEKADDERAPGLFDQSGGVGYRVRDGITDAALKHFRCAYQGEKITKEDVFYYIYGILHSEDYRSRYADNLSKELPRIPCVRTATDFWRFSECGRELAELHVGYERVEPYPVSYKPANINIEALKPEDFRVVKMKFGKNKDKSTVIYNHKITMTAIPPEAYEYVVNGKPALEWVMERQAVTTDKKSGILNDANLYAIETVGDPAYPLKLFQRVITVSLETMRIVRSLPKLDIRMDELVREDDKACGKNRFVRKATAPAAES